MPGSEMRPEQISRRMVEFAPPADRGAAGVVDSEKQKKEEKKQYYRDHLLEDLRIATKFVDKKQPTAQEEFEARKNARARLEEHDVDTKKIVKRRQYPTESVDKYKAYAREVRDNIELLGLAVGSLRPERIVGDPDGAISAIGFLGYLGADMRILKEVGEERVVEFRERSKREAEEEAKPKIEIPATDQEAKEAEERSKQGESLKPAYEGDFDELIRITEGDPEARRREIGDWRRKYRKASIPPEYLKEVLSRSLQAQRDLEKIRADFRAGSSAFGRSEAELSGLGVEERAQRKDPVIVELERPILGHKIPFEYGASYSAGFRTERRALNEDEAFSPERVKLLLASSWTEALRIYNGEVTSDTKADISALSQMEQILRTRIAEIEHTYTTAMKEGKKPQGEEKGKVFFASLVPLGGEEEEPIRPDLGEVYQTIRTGGFNALDDDLKRRIPELMALEEMKKILAWHEAQQQLLRAIQSMRSFSTGKKIDSLAALGDQADKPLLPTSAILKIWGLEELREKPKEKGEKISRYTEEAKRIYHLISEVGRSNTLKFGPDGEVIFDDADEKVRFLKGLVWKYLIAEDRVIEGGYRRDVKYILNRFGPNLNVEKLAQVEAFVEYSINRGAWVDYSKLDRADFDVELGKYIGAAKKRVTSGEEEPEIKEPNEANKRIEVRLGCANAVASIHVTGLADSWARYVEWSSYSFLKNVPGEDMEKKIIGARKKGEEVGASYWNVGEEPNENDRFPVIKIGGYPACTALAELVNFTDKLEGDIGLGLSVGPKTLVEAIRDKDGKRRETNGVKWVPDSLAKNFLEFTVLSEGGELKSIGKYWKEGLSLDELAGKMVNQSPTNAHGSWLGSLKASNKIRALLTATDSENYGNMFKNDQLPTDLFQSIFNGLGFAYNDEMKRTAAYLRGVIYAGLLTYTTGLTRQLSSAEVNKRLLDLRGGTPSATRELEYFIDKLILDSLEGNRGDKKIVEPINGAVTSEGFVVFKDLVEGQYMRLTGKKLTQGGLHPAVIADQPGGIPYARIWDNPVVDAKGTPAKYSPKYSLGGEVYKLKSTI